MEVPVRIENRAQMIYLLTEAAELEHSIMCCYLFNAATIKTSTSEGLTDDQLRKVRGWKRTISQIAVDEMVHFALACNLLSAIGGAPHLRRPNIPTSPRAYPPTFKLGFIPFTQDSLKTFVYLERPEGSDAQPDSAESTVLPKLQTNLSDIFASERAYSTVGHLYRGIEDGFEYLAQKYGEEQLFIGPDAAQVADTYFKLPGLIPVTGLSSAVAAIQGIVAQGEGAPGDNKDSHHSKFQRILEEYEALLAEDPEFTPGRPVVTNPYALLPGDIADDRDVTMIEDPLSVDVSNLFDGCYEILIHLLGRLFAHGEESDDELAVLADVAVGLMFDAIGPLGGALTSLPAGPSNPGMNAGPSFKFSRDVNTLPHKTAAWIVISERLKELSAYCGFMQPTEAVAPTLAKVQTALSGYAEKLISE